MSNKLQLLKYNLNLDTKFIKEASFALIITVIGGLVTGIIWSSLYFEFITVAGMIALIPVISQMRGNISGIFTSRLGTGLHIGFIKPEFKKRSKELNHAIYMNIILSITVPIWVAIVVYLFHTFGGGQTPLIRFIFIGLLGSIIAGGFQIIITLFIAFLVFLRGMDPDVIVYPVLSLIADIITAFSILIAFRIENFIFNILNSFLLTLLGLLTIAFFIFILIITFSRPMRSKLKFELLNLLSEAMPVMLTTVIIGTLVGVILSNEIPYQGIILILPVFMAYTGSMGSIVGSTFTTSYHLGQPFKKQIPIILIFIGTIISLGLGFLGFLINSVMNFSLPENFTFLMFISVCLFTGIFTTSFSILNSLILGNYTFKKGIDADNVIVPITSTIGDLVAILSIVTLLIVL